MAQACSKKFLVLVPCRNEQDRIGKVIDAIHHVLPAAPVVVVDDGSGDRTREQALAHGATVLSHVVNLGYGAALETGYLYAMKNRFQAVLQMDGDGQHLAEELPRLLAPLEAQEADLVIGSRHLAGEPDPSSSFIRHVGQKLFGLIVSALTRRHFSDPTSGFQGLGNRALRLFASGVFPYDYPDTDVLLMSHLAGLRITETPVHMLSRAEGKSMHTWYSACYYVFKMFLSIFVVLLNSAMWKRWRKHAA